MGILFSQLDPTEGGGPYLFFFGWARRTHSRRTVKRTSMLNKNRDRVAGAHLFTWVVTFGGRGGGAVFRSILVPDEVIEAGRILRGCLTVSLACTPNGLAHPFSPQLSLSLLVVETLNHLA